MNNRDVFDVGSMMWPLVSKLFLWMLPLLGLRIGLSVLDSYMRKKRRLTRALRTPFSEKVKRLTETLDKASQEMDQALEEMSLVSQIRESALADMEKKLETLSGKEQQLKAEIQALETVSHPVADRFAELVERASERGERRSAIRDYALFALGVITPSLVSLLMKLFGY